MKPLTFIGSLCIILGIFFLGRKQRKGWVFQFSGSALSVVHFWFVAYDPSVVILNIILGSLAAWSWWKWGELIKGGTWTPIFDWVFSNSYEGPNGSHFRTLPTYPRWLCGWLTGHIIDQHYADYNADIKGVRCRCGSSFNE